MSFRSKSPALALAASVCLFGVGAFAQSAVHEVVVRPSASAAGDVRTTAETVSYADLDLGRAAGARALLLRLRAAAKRVCAPEPTSHEPTDPYRRCVRSSVDRAVAEVDSSTGLSLHMGG